MKIILYSLDDEHSIKFKEFLIKNKMPFGEIKLNNKILSCMGISFLKIIYSHSIHELNGYDEKLMNQLLEHIKKYNPKIEI